MKFQSCPGDAGSCNAMPVEAVRSGDRRVDAWFFLSNRSRQVTVWQCNAGPGNAMYGMVFFTFKTYPNLTARRSMVLLVGGRAWQCNSWYFFPFQVRARHGRVMQSPAWQCWARRGAEGIRAMSGWVRHGGAVFGAAGLCSEWHGT